MKPFISKFVNEVGKKDDFFFIQVGANDGLMCDPIRQFIVKHSWGGILVEPVPDYFELLKKNYLESFRYYTKWFHRYPWSTREI